MYQGRFFKEVSFGQHSVKYTEYAMEKQCHNTWAQILTLLPISHVIMEKYFIPLGLKFIDFWN